MSGPEETGPGAEIDALVAAYAFDALEGQDRADVEELLHRSPALVARLADFQGAVASWGSGSTAVSPPEMRAHVLSRLDEVQQLPAAADDAAAVLDEPRPVRHLTSVPGGAGGAVPQQSRRPRARRREQRPVVAVLLAAAVAVGVGAAGIGGWQLLQPRAQAQELAGALDRIEAAPDVETVTAEGVGAPELEGTQLVYSASQGEAVVTAADELPDLDDRVYAVWRLDDAGAPQLAGRFSGGRGGVLDGGAEGASAVAVTIEPEDVGDRPTTPVVALYEISA